MMKVGAIGRLGDVTELLQTQRQSVACACRNGQAPSLPSPMRPQGRRSGGITPGNFGNQPRVNRRRNKKPSGRSEVARCSHSIKKCR